MNIISYLSNCRFALVQYCLCTPLWINTQAGKTNKHSLHVFNVEKIFNFIMCCYQKSV